MPEDFVIDNLQGILDSIELIETRFVGVANSDGFVLNADGVLTLDSICMRLQIIGDLLKKINKINPVISRCQNFATLFSTIGLGGFHCGFKKCRVESYLSDI